MAESRVKDWTIMVYMAGDNNLSENMAVALEDIRSTMGSVSRKIEANDVNLLVFFDGNSLTAPTQYIDFSEMNRSEPAMRHTPQKKDIHHRNKSKRSEKVTPDDLEEGNAASAYSIMNFVRWCIRTKKRTAKNYAIIFSGHSFGFHGTSFLRDDSAGGSITLFKFRYALEQIKELYLGNNKIDILGFDSCVMSMLEVGFELKDVAETIVASEGSLPNSGWSYAPLLKRFLPDFKEKTRKQLSAAFNGEEALQRFSKTLGVDKEILETVRKSTEILKTDPLKIGAAESMAAIDKAMDSIVEESGFIRLAASDFVSDLIHHHNRLLIGGRSIDVAAWDLNEIEPIVRNLSLFAAKLNECLDLSQKIEDETPGGGLTESDIEIFQELRKIVLQSHYDSQTYMNEQCVDLADFCQRFIIECKFMEKGENFQIYTDLIQLAKDIIIGVKKCVLNSGFSGDEYQFSNGISLFFPWSNLTFSLTNYRYRYLLFCKGKNRNGLDIEKPETYDGLGKEWYHFLRNYIFRVSIRPLRKITEIQDGKEIERKSVLDDFSKSNPIWSRSNPIWSKSNPIWSKSNPDASRSNPPWSRSNPDASKSNPDASRSNPDASRGEFGNYLYYFSRFKNFQYKWDISGFSGDFGFEADFDDDSPDKLEKKK